MPMMFTKEADFEDAVVHLLAERGWKAETLDRPTESDLIKNWKERLFARNRDKNALNGCPLTDTEMQQILDHIATLRTPVKLNDFINGKSVTIRRDNPADKLNCGKDVSLIIYDRTEIAGGTSVYQIARQPVFRTRSPILNNRRGDIMLLINGMPVIHVELKRSGIPVSQAYNQIEKYSREGAFTGIFSLVQVFVAMTPEETVYFANPGDDGEFSAKYRFHWADFNNELKNDWQTIVDELLSIPMAHELIGFYTVADTNDNTLKVLRSYQYYAAKRIAMAVRKKDWGANTQLGGYVWHTTGSGKTLTSFKSAHLIASAQDADKVLFLVDRKALGTQSFWEFTGFAGNLLDVRDTKSGKRLVQRLKSDNDADMLIVTSIQKLSEITKKQKYSKAGDIEKIRRKRLVIIIDEAHRSTFGDMLLAIKQTFDRAILFGFTGTPIHDVNSKKNNNTADVLGDELHRYTLADGIQDGNVLGFDVYKEMVYPDDKVREEVALMKAKARSVNEALGNKHKARIYRAYMNPAKVKMYGEYVGAKYKKGIEDFLGNSQYELPEYQLAVIQNIKENWERLSSLSKFHAIFATSSIPEAVAYYRLLKEMAPELMVTAVFDPAIDNGGQSLAKEEGIAEILTDYNEKFQRQFSLKNYDRFRDDVQKRLAHKNPYRHIAQGEQIDLLIVVNQMLTGYDSKWVNTLYLDKMLEYENLIQAFSRTNRLFGEEKPFGIIKYYRRPHTMEQNILKAIGEYSGNIPTGLFADKLPLNLTNLNSVYDQIEALFKADHIENFERLPEEKVDKAKFAKLVGIWNRYLEAAKIQGFVWEKTVYDFTDTKPPQHIEMHFDYRTYLTIMQRYKELASGGGGVRGDDVPFDIDPRLTEVRTDIIDADFMNKRFEKFLKVLRQQGSSPGALDESLAELKKSYAMLPKDEQRYADMFLADVQSGVIIDIDKTFRDYIAAYKKKAEDEKISKVTEGLGLDEEKLRELLSLGVTEDNINDLGRLDDLKNSIDKGKAAKFFGINDWKLNKKIDDFLRSFILSGGKVLEGQEVKRKATSQKDSSATATQSDSGGNTKAVTAVNRQKLTEWYGQSGAVASLLKSGAVAYVEGHVCLLDSKYIERTPEGKLRLTAYARTHEEECFLQFLEDDSGEILHYVRLPASKANKDFHYADYITPEILQKFGLVSEMVREMLDQIHGMPFGNAMTELMSKRVCGYSNRVLRDNTGLDLGTIGNMRKGKNLTLINVVSACLGLHVPLPVSRSMLALANLAIDPGKPPLSNAVYDQLLAVYWAWDYEDTYKYLLDDGQEGLLKTPPAFDKAKRNPKK